MTRSHDYRSADELSALVVASPTNLGKIRRHVEPLASVTDHTTMVCLSPSQSTEKLRYVSVPAPVSRYVGIVLLYFVALREGLRGEYDVVVSFSLFPYGVYALLLGAVLRVPTHLAVLGIDVDYHAHAWYGAAVQTLFRRFDVVSVPGSEHRRTLVDMGVDERRIATLANAIDVDRFSPDPDGQRSAFDFVWVGRFSEEKNPSLFVRGLERLRARGIAFRAAMVGTGPLADAVASAVEQYDLEEQVVLPGWVDDPYTYYRQSETFVLTSRRDALPLTLLEAMATGCSSVVRPVGSVTDVALHGETAFVVEDMTAETLADALERLLTDDALRERLGQNAVRVRERYSFDAAGEDWKTILSKAQDPTRSTDRPKRSGGATGRSIEGR